MSQTFNTSILSPESQILLKTVQDRLNAYIETMAPGKAISAVDGAFQQTQLWQGVIKFLLQQPPEVFMVGWAVFLDSVAAHRTGAFSPAYINRFREDLKLTLIERRNFERMVHLAYVTAEKRTRTLALKQVDINVILAGLPSEEQRQKVLGFYQL